MENEPEETMTVRKWNGPSIVNVTVYRDGTVLNVGPVEGDITKELILRKFCEELYADEVQQ